MNRPLDRLCECYGVLPGYNDIWGDSHVTSDPVRLRLLSAMGVAANTDQEIEAALLEHARRQWQRVLPPVQVVREAERPYRILLALPQAVQSAPCRWRIRLEKGGEHQGTFIPADLEEAARSRLDGEDYSRRALRLDMEIAPGYHRLSVESADGKPMADEMSFIVAPATCYQPPAIRKNGRIWGFAAQLYSVRSERNWGIGDFGDLRHILEFCAETGASTVLTNPLHALFPAAPENTSPYSPSSRIYFNVLYLDVEGIPEFGECANAQAMVRSPGFQARLRALRAADKVDYRAVAAAKLEVLECMYPHFRTHHLLRETERGRAFRAFQSANGETLHKLALFDALHAHFQTRQEDIGGWPDWPEPYRNPESAEVAAFSEANSDQVEFYEFLQWQAARQIAAAGTRSWELGLGVGIMLDLAVGVAEGGAATWTRPGLHAMGVHTGAPPDELNRLGQDWGLPPWIPHRLSDAAYQPFIELLRTNMRDAGALRLDHVMGLRRLFWIARDTPIAEGAYVAYPFDDLLGILALESRRNRCMVIGEDLGTVPDEVRQALAPLDVLSTRLLYFERGEDGGLKPYADYPRNALAAVTTHDLAPLAGFWRGQDIELRDRLHLFPDDHVRNEHVVDRSTDRAQLLVALEGAGLLPAGGRLQPISFPEMSAELATAVYRYLACSPSKLLLLTFEDGFGMLEQPNLPGTTEPVYPCWRLKLPLNLEEWHTNDYLKSILLALRRERPVVKVAEAAEGAVGEGLKSWIPRATYRLQLNPDFDLSQAMALIAYLDELGISHCYLSPILKARRGSRHGYDITDHTSLNPEIANAEEVDRFVTTLRQHGMGLLLDIVPNHMGVMGSDNGWWLDVLENGPASRFADYFDIDWHPVAEEMSGHLLLPVLGDHYGAVLERAELQLAFSAEHGSFSIFYYEHRLPIDPREYPLILGYRMEQLEARLGAEDPVLLEYRSLLTAFSHLPPRDSVTAAAVAERARDKEVHKRHLAALFVSSTDIARFVQENIDEFNGTAPNESNFTLLHDLLQAQAYRLSFWKAGDEINYRRFFDINDLAALRIDNPEVFEATHRLIRELLARGHVNGLRIDHSDGLYAPGEYFERLQAMATALLPAGAGAAAERSKPLYLVTEKILAVHEHLTETWPIHGTTGYDFSAFCGGLFIDRRGERPLLRLYRNFTRERPDFSSLLIANKHLIMDTSLAGELQVLAVQLTRIARSERRTCDFTLNSLRKALADIVASFPVYRTYVVSSDASPDDVRYVDWAVDAAKKTGWTTDTSIFEFVRDVLLMRQAEGKSDDYRKAVCTFAMKFQQYTSPVMAKAFEDTTLYQYNRLVALNEVGDDPRRFGVSPTAFHRANQARIRKWPHAMLASSTHDSKRSEDVRARIGVLSEMPDAWQKAIQRWSRLNAGQHRSVDAPRAPSRNDEYLLYQTLIGIWPFEPPAGPASAGLMERLEDYMIKAVREAKVNSSWLNPDEVYEAVTRGFIRTLLAPDPDNAFLADFIPFQARVARIGALGSLAQLLLKLTSPGVPDIYQGCELWNFSLVDPDNRRSVDHSIGREALKAVKALHDERGAAHCATRLLDSLADGRIKLYLTWKVLNFRKRNERVFAMGSYRPLRVHGRHAEHVCAFMRVVDGECVTVIVPRLIHRLSPEAALPVGRPVWADTWLELPSGLPGNPWQDVLTDRSVTSQPMGKAAGIALADIFETFPFALLYSAALKP